MSDNYTQPANYDAVLTAAKDRALADSDFAAALRDIDSHYGERYAQGVLSAIGLWRLGRDYAEAWVSVEIASRNRDEAAEIEVALGAEIPADAVVERDLFGAPIVSTAEGAAARARLKAARAHYDEIKNLVMPFAKAGETPDYDPSFP